MNPSLDLEQTNFNPFNYFNDRDQQDIKDLELNYFKDLNTNTLITRIS